MATISTSYKLVYEDPLGKTGTFTINNPADSITAATLSAVADDFEAVGYEIQYGYYQTVTKDDPVSLPAA